MTWFISHFEATSTKTVIYWNSRNIAVIEVMKICHLQFVTLVNNYGEAQLDLGSFGFQLVNSGN